MRMDNPGTRARTLDLGDLMLRGEVVGSRAQFHFLCVRKNHGTARPRRRVRAHDREAGGDGAAAGARARKVRQSEAPRAPQEAVTGKRARSLHRAAVARPAGAARAPDQAGPDDRAANRPARLAARRRAARPLARVGGGGKGRAARPQVRRVGRADRALVPRRPARLRGDERDAAAPSEIGVGQGGPPSDGAVARPGRPDGGRRLAPAAREARGGRGGVECDAKGGDGEGVEADPQRAGVGAPPVGAPAAHVGAPEGAPRPQDGHPPREGAAALPATPPPPSSHAHPVRPRRARSSA